MQDFDSLKNIWQQPAAGKAPAMIDINKKLKTTKMKLLKPQLHGAVYLTLTTIFIICLAIFGNLNFQHWYTYGAMALISLICLLQASFMFITYKKIKRIDETAAPSTHLQQWEAYYDLRKKQLKWNMPVYYILLNMAMAIYVIELFTGRPFKNVIIFIAVYAAWMLFAYFYLGKRGMQRETNRLQSIIDELGSKEKQLKAEG